MTSVGLLSGCALWACSGDDSNTDGGTDSGVDAVADHTTIDVTTPPDTGVDSGTDVNTSDVTVNDSQADADDAALDAGQDADALAPEGTPCSPPNDIQQEGCGLCGTQFRGCLPDSDGGFSWAPWGFCQNQVVNGCDPTATYPDSTCGNCGTKKSVCLSNCTFDQTQTCTEPLNACKPGSTQFQLGLSCDGGGRERLCDQQCQFGNYGACQSGPSLPKLQVPGTVGNIASLVQTLNSTDKIGRMGSGSCPSTVSSSITSYNYIVVENPTSQQATIDIWHSQAPNSVYIDSVMTVYPGVVPPDNNNTSARDACNVYVNDTCFDSTISSPASCVSSWAGLMKGDSHQVVLSAGASVVLYSAAYFTTSVGDFQINVKTLSLL